MSWGSEGEKTTAHYLRVGVPAACEPKPEPGLDTGCSPSADSEVEGDGKLLDLSEQQGIVGEPPGEKSQKTASL